MQFEHGRYSFMKNSQRYGDVSKRLQSVRLGEVLQQMRAYTNDRSLASVGCCLQTIFKDSLVTFCVSRRRRRVYCGHARLCVYVSVCLSAAVRPHYCTDPDVTWGRGRGCPLVVHCWADMQSVHGLRCYGNITRTLVYAGCAHVAD